MHGEKHQLKGENPFGRGKAELEKKAGLWETSRKTYHATALHDEIGSWEKVGGITEGGVEKVGTLGGFGHFLF